MSTSTQEKPLVDVAVPLPLFSTFTYSFSDDQQNDIGIGKRVVVPFGRRKLTGYIVGFPETSSEYAVKQVEAVLDEEPLFVEADLQFYTWAATYYCYPLGLTIKTALPRGLSGRYGYRAAITDEGKRFLDKAGSGSKRDRTLLQELASGGEASLLHLQQRLKSKTVLQALRRLQDKGLVDLSIQQQGAAVRIRKEKWYSCTEPLNDTLRGKQRDLAAFINEHGCVSATALRDRFGTCSAQISALRKKELLSVEEREVFRRPPRQETVFHEPIRDLTADQKKVVDQAGPAVEKKEFYPLLLHGVTGSGKTEVYLQIMQKVLAQGRQCLYLVPEISLTTQLWDRISSRLDVPIAMLHSNLTPGERFDAWRMIRRGEIKIVIGARSAVFASFNDLGAIIVDEEHDPSYKQDDSLRYNARDLALVKARSAGCIVVLGSATPSLESYYNALTHKYSLGVLSRRVEEKPMPPVHIIDMTTETHLQKKKGMIVSRRMHTALEKRLTAGQQSILFLNRRGFSPSYVCRQCGYTFKCRNCDVTLIHHKGQRKLTCHYCDFFMPVPEECPECNSFFLTSLGWGTERVESELAQLFPEARIARMDRDSILSRGSLHTLMAGMHRGDIDILIGTQMIVKGYHLPNVTLVGVMCADQSLNFPDYRAGERTFQLLTQVAGRAGRGDAQGEVIIQTYNPDHYSIQQARLHDYERFYETEIPLRKELGYPPFAKMINVRFEGASKTAVERLAQRAGTITGGLLASPNFRDRITILGPAAAPWERIKGRYRYQMLVKGASIQQMRTLVMTLLESIDADIKKSGVKVLVDVDPVFVL